MAIETGVERYIPKPEVDLAGYPVGQSFLEVGGKTVPHLETLDFPKDDPWSETMREVIAKVRKEGGFEGQRVTELGVGDGRNIRILGEGADSILGVDIENWRLEVAGFNLVTGPARIKPPVELWRGDAVELLRDLKITGRDRLTGRVIMCLPQSPDGANATDRYNGSSSLDAYRTDHDKYGLTLNVATLDAIRPLADKDLLVYAIISDRIPPEAKDQMFFHTGWRIRRQFQTETPVQQDPTTGIHWVRQVDDGRRFYEQVTVGQFSPISAIESERRRLASLASGRFREDLNVYHHLTVYELGIK